MIKHYKRSSNRKQVTRSDGTVFPSIKAAAASLNLSPASVSRVCNGHAEKAGGHGWRFGPPMRHDRPATANLKNMKFIALFGKDVWDVFRGTIHPCHLVYLYGGNTIRVNGDERALVDYVRIGDEALLEPFEALVFVQDQWTSSGGP